MPSPGPDARSPVVRVERFVARVNAFVTSTLLVVLTLDVLWGVTTRFALGQQARWTEEAARLLLVWVTMLGGAMAYSAGAHLGLDTVVARMDPAVARFCRRAAGAAVYAFAFAVMVVGGAMLYAERLRFGQTMPALGVSRSWQYLAVPIAGVLICLTAVREVFDPADLPADLPAEPTAEPSPERGGERPS